MYSLVRVFPMGFLILTVNLAMNAWLLTVVYRQQVRKQLPWFALYVAWEFLLACIQIAAWAISSRFYVSVYWWTEAIDVVLTVAAVRESFLRIFEGFTRLRWFRWSVSGVIAGVVLYSAWKAVYAPPLQATRLGSFVIGAEFAFRWGIAGIGLLTMMLMYLLDEPLRSREGSIVVGFGIASVGFLAWVLSRSLFGTKYIIVSKYFPTVGYFVAAFLWIRAFLRPIAEFGFRELGMGPEDIARELRRYREHAERMMGKK